MRLFALFSCPELRRGAAVVLSSRPRRHRATILRCWAALLFFLLLTTRLLAQNVLTHQYDNNRSNVQPNETILNPSNVNATDFGKVFSWSVDGWVFAQPLYIANVTMNDGLSHNVVFVATEHDSVYAFDADGKNPSAGYLWKKSLLGSGESTVVSSDVNSGDIPEIGITGTPVIDPSTNTLYVVAKSKYVTSSSTTFYQRLHALNLADGSEKMSGPTVIKASASGTASGGSTVTFDPRIQNQRPGLTLANTSGGTKVVWIAWASHGDKNAYHGWVIGYDAANITQQAGVFVTTPNGSEGGIWMSGGGLVADTSGNLFFAVGNGSANASCTGSWSPTCSTSGKNFGESVVKLKTSSSGALSVADWFTPYNQASLNSGDWDIDASVIAFQDPSSSTSDLLITGGKAGELYLIDRNQMGRYDSSKDHVMQEFGEPRPSGSSGSADYTLKTALAYFNNTLYVGAQGTTLKAFSFQPGSSSSAGSLNTTASSASSNSFGNNNSNGAGTAPVISASGVQDAIVWALDDYGYSSNSPAILYAYDAVNLGNMLYASTQAANSRDQAAPAVKFTEPTVANGRVYVGGEKAITVYGLLNQSPSAPAPPVFSPSAGTYANPQTVSISDSTSGVQIYYTTDGSTPTTSSTQYTGSITVTSTETIKAVASNNGTLSSVSSATYTIITAAPTFSPAAGTYTNAQSVTLSDATSGAQIYYTTDGSTPTTSSTQYTGSITVTSTETIKAIAASNGVLSAVSSATYTITTATPTFSPRGGTYSSVQTVTISDATSGAQIYYTTDGSTPTTSSTPYTGAITVSSTETIQAIAVNNGISSAVASAAYTIRVTVATPTFSPRPGIYSSAQTVTISDATSGAQIYYTTDGSTPTANSTLYTAPIPVSSSETISAVAIYNGYSSPVYRANYRINTGSSRTRP